MTQIAVQTLANIEAALQYDQGNAFRHWQGLVMPHIGDAYRQDSDLFRSHMGASTIGRDCAREVWYSFHWATAKRAEGKMIRLWNRGHLEEGRFIALLLMIGCVVIQQDEHGKQFRISDYGGHYGGSGDGMLDGIPDLPPGTRALSEFKTHNDKSFVKLAGSNWAAWVDYHIYKKPLPNKKPPPAFEGEGLRVAKPEHYIQMQQYMRKMGLSVGLYAAVNKNSDLIYMEIVPLDVECADRFLHRAIQIIPMRTAPKRISEQPGWFGCKFCDHSPVCHYGAPPERNCRTCLHSVAKEDGKWWCENPDRQMKMLFDADRSADICSADEQDYSLSKQRQLSGCSMWTVNHTAFKT